ncbi:MAG: hypothetical protein K9L66_05700 [Spirochaetaceae bacterium]|nr:hypothetical protein [Spirochaetaceae bacterium]MCF7938739.1 hypothetical protein [Spirochaetales bacterium]
MRSATKLLLSLFFISVLGAQATAAPLPVKNLTPAEQEQLARQQVVMRVLGTHRDIRFEAAHKIERFNQIKPNYLYEAMFILPVEPGSEQKVLQAAKDFLQEPERLEKIPYYSRHNGNWTRLFADIEVEALPVYADGSEGLVTRQLMIPFEPYTAAARYRLTEDMLVYTTTNRSPLYYKWMKGVKAEQMNISMLVQASPGRLFFYGLVGAKAFDFFGLFHNRLDQAFAGRAEAIFEWFHKEFVVPRLKNRITNE